MSEEPEVTISYLILCHDSPDRIVRLVTRILSDDETGQVVIHFDKNSSRPKFRELQTRLYGTPRCYILKRRIRCGWGQWSLVKASLTALDYARKNNKTTYYYLLSEYCYPLPTFKNLTRYLRDSACASFVECYDQGWIKGGIREDRYLYRHFVNKRKNPKLHRFLYRIQKKLFIRRKKPKNLNFKFGSQWWCLHYSHVDTLKKVDKSIIKFFKFVWIPDECFFGTMLYSYGVTIVSESLTFSKFDINGIPIIYSAESISSIQVGGNKFFIRKVQ